MSRRNKVPAYHLRLNKAVDRFLLVDALRCIPYNFRRRYVYCGLGGPFLEDFRVLEQYFPEIKKKSFEINDATFKRQAFNCFSKNVKIICGDMVQSLGDEFASGRPKIVWFDCTESTPKVLQDFISILDNMPSKSIVRLTMRVAKNLPDHFAKIRASIIDSVECIVDDEDCLNDDAKTRLKDRIKNSVKDCIERSYPFVNSFDDIRAYLPDDYKEQLKKSLGPVNMLKSAVQAAVNKAFPYGSDNRFNLMNISYYSDGTTMLSIMGAVTSEKDTDGFMAYFKNTMFAKCTWESLDQIEMPTLTVKERQILDPVLPVSPSKSRSLKSKLGYELDEDVKMSRLEYEMYNRYFRHYPSFVKAYL